MVVSSYNGNLLDLEQTLKVIGHKDFEKKEDRFSNRYVYRCLYGWLNKKPLIIRCMLREWQDLESEYLS